MRVFLTGATGFVGSAVARQLLAANHAVAGLARSDASIATLEQAGVTPHRGDLNDHDSLRAAAIEADAIIHCGFIHDFANFAASVQTDRRAIEVFGDVLAGTGKHLIVTSGTAGLSPGRPATEEDSPNPAVYEGTPRVSEQTALALAPRNILVSVIRLPPSVHGNGDHGFVPTLIDIARRKGVSAYIGNGDNRWPAVHRDDAALAFRLVLEKGSSTARYHAVAEQGIAFRDIAANIGRKLGLPVTSVTPENAVGHFGWMANFARMDVPASHQLTSDRLAWHPTGPGLLEDLENDRYFLG